jgi:hypothetical protein
MPSIDVSNETSAETLAVEAADMKLEVVVVPVRSYATLRRSATRTATAGCCKRSRRDFPGGEKA